MMKTIYKNNVKIDIIMIIMNFRPLSVNTGIRGYAVTR